MNPHPHAMNRLLLTLALLGAAHTAWADGERRARVPLTPTYVQECAACHAAYPPGMLPAASWARIMNGLDRHYGTDASLDAATVRQLATWLDANASPRAAPPPQDRITQSRWFQHEHGGIAPAVWKLPSVKSAANCAACHTDTESGRYSEHALRMPAGLTPAQQRAFQDD